MRHLRKFCAVVVLTCAFALSIHAGEVSCPGVTSTAPQAAGEMQNGITDVLLIMLALI
jgi:hypothetical protein